MQASLPRYQRKTIGGLTALGFVVILLGNGARAQTEAPDAGAGVIHGGWLNPTPAQQGQTETGGTVTVTSKQNTNDPFNVLSTGALWQEQYDTAYHQKLADSLSLTCETTATTFDEAIATDPLAGSDESDDLANGQKLALQVQPSDALTLRVDLHDSMNGESNPGDASITTGTGFWAEDHLPTGSDLTFGLNSDQTSPDVGPGNVTTFTAYDAQLKQPLGQLPVTAVVKGHYQEVVNPGTQTGRSPSLEQSLVWKPMQDSSVQMGLRQQQYQEYPGITDQFNEALFADWSQKLAGEISWHSYAEVLNSRSLVDQAPAGLIASGANGTPQATTPGSNASLSSALPISLEDQTLTFSTGPSFQLQKDISASVEYSNRWDRNPAPGSLGQEQRVSVSLKGTF